MATLATGAALIGEELYRYGTDWFRWLQSWVILSKVCLLALALVHGDTVALWAALVAGAVISHAPGVVRQWPLWGDAGPCAQRAQDKMEAAAKTRSSTAPAPSNRVQT